MGIFLTYKGILDLDFKVILGGFLFWIGYSQKTELGNALHDALFKKAEKNEKISLITVKGAGVKPGVDLQHSSSLLDIMDEL